MPSTTGCRPDAALATELAAAAARGGGRGLEPARIAQVLFVLEKWRAPAPPALLAAGAAALSERAREMDGPCVCSLAGALARLGARLDAGALAAAEARLVELMAQEQVAAGGKAAAAAAPGRRQQPLALRRRARLPARPRDVAVFLGACGACGYVPASLLRRWCVQLRTALADRGAAALSEAPPTAAAAAAAAAAARPAAGAGATAASEEQQDAAAAAAQRAAQSSSSSSSNSNTSGSGLDAGPLAAVVTGLAAVGWRDAALMRDLEAAAMRRPLVGRVSPAQLALFAHGCRRLGFVPSAWLRAGLGRRLLRALPAMGPRDAAQVLCAVADWARAPGSGVALSRLPWSAIADGAQQKLLEAPASAPAAAPASPAAAAAGAADEPAAEDDAAPGAELLPSPPTTSAANAPAAPPAAAPVLRLRPAELLDVLCALSALGRYDERLVELILSRLQAAEPGLTLPQLSAAAHAAAALRHEPTALLAALRRRFSAGGAGGGARALEAAGDPGSLAARLLWTFGQLGQHPGQELISAATTALARWCDGLTGASAAAGGAAPAEGAAAAGQAEGPDYDLSPAFDFDNDGDMVEGADAQQAAGSGDSGSGSGSGKRRPQRQLPLRELSTALYSLALVGELQHPGALSLAARLADAPAAALLAHPAFGRQARMLAACALTAQAERLAGSPWARLGAGVKERLAAAWRGAAVARGAARPHRMQLEVAAALRGMGLRARAGEVTRDGCCCIDVLARAPASGGGGGSGSGSGAAALPPPPLAAAPDDASSGGSGGGAAGGEWLAIEILGPHNAARNTQAPLGAARLKWRLLAARGYRVAVVDGWEWLRHGGPEAVARQLYLQNLRNQLLRQRGPTAAQQQQLQQLQQQGGSDGGTGSPAAAPGSATASRDGGGERVPVGAAAGGGAGVRRPQLTRPAQPR